MNIKVAIALALALAAATAMLVAIFTPSPRTAPERSTTGVGVSEPAEAQTAAFAEDVSAAHATVGPTMQGSVPPSSSEEVWVEQLDTILGSDEANATTVGKLISALPTLPPEAQEEYVAHAANLCEDEQFGQLANLYLAASTPRAVVEMIFDDALNRPDEIKLPMLAQSLRNASHPMAAESREILEMYLDLEPGSSPSAGWDAAVQEYLRAEANAE